MKYFQILGMGVTFLFLIFSQVVVGQQWSAEVEIADGDTPEMDIDPVTGNVYVLSMYNGVTITVLDKYGNFISRETVPGTEKDQGGGIFGAAIAVDSQGYPHICYRETHINNRYSTYYIKKTTSGWTSPLLLWYKAYRGYMIRIDVDENNVAHIVEGFGFDEDIWGRVNYFRVINNVKDKEQILGTSFHHVYRTDDRIEIETFPGGYIYVLSGVPDPGGNVFYFYSTDGGDTYSEGQDIHHTNAYGRNGSPDLQIDNNGNVHACYGTSEDATRNGKPAIYYTRFEDMNQIKNDIVTTVDELVDWNIGMGLGSIACSDHGQSLVLAYVSEPGGTLSARNSQDGGNTWSDATELASNCGSDLGRNKHIIRGNGDIFYLVYPSNWKIWLRTLDLKFNEPPTADAGGPYTGNEGSAISFDASHSFDTDGTIVQYEWDWNNDGIYDQTTTSATFQYSYADDYNGNIKLQVTDGGGKKATGEANVTVLNVPPTANANGPYSGDKNIDITLTGSATDPGTLDVLTYKWDLDNDDIYETSGETVVANYSTGGSHQVKFKVTDDDGGEDVDITSVNVSNQPPVVSSIQNQQINEGQSFTPIQLDDYVQDPDNADSEISWEAHGQTNLVVNITANRIAYIEPSNPDWTGSETITFTARDLGDLSSSTTATFTIINVNDPPKLLEIPSQTKDEGTAFDPIHVDNYVEDPDNIKTELIWQIQGNNTLTPSWNGHILSILWPNEDWYGSETLTFSVTDPGGLSDEITATFTINNVNDPPVISGLTGQTIRADQEFAAIYLDEVVSDVDNPDNELSWSYSGNVQLQVNIDASRVVRITKPSIPNWTGIEIITFLVTDGIDSDKKSVTFIVNEANYPPVISSNLVGQTVGENQQFQPIYLDGFVSDPNNSDAEITWELTGFHDLIVSWPDRIVNIAVPDSEWSGSETITFIARDLQGLADTAAAIFTVIPLNDPPKWEALQDYTINEDDTLKIGITFLKTKVMDPDNGPDDFQFDIINLINLDWTNNWITNTLNLFARQPDWSGSETITIAVYDGEGGSDVQSFKLTIGPVPDVPLPFNVISPNNTVFNDIPSTITFVWHRANDPDVGDVIKYNLSISDMSNFQHVFDSFPNLSDTTYQYSATQQLLDGIYYWRVKATDSNGLYRFSNDGKFSIDRTAVSDDSKNGIPSDYSLIQNFPNPFNPRTCITYHLPQSGYVEIAIFNSLGQHIRTIESGEKNAGVYQIFWDGCDETGILMSSGIYICQLKTNDRMLSQKMLLMQ